MHYKPRDLSECMRRYGTIDFSATKKLYWPNDSDWVLPLEVPQEIQPYLLNSMTKSPTKRIFCNKDMHEPLTEAFDNILAAKCESEFKTFDGCYNVRYVRGSSTVLSLHSYALALDFNAATNPLGGKSSWSNMFIRCFVDVGFIWGGNFKARKDPMHFQWLGELHQAQRLAS